MAILNLCCMASADGSRRGARDVQLARIYFHCLRHAHASQLIASGMDVLTISRRLGHGSLSIALGDYGHLFENADSEEAQVVARTSAGMA